MRQITKVIKGCFPKLGAQLALLADHRKRRDYEVAELVTGAIAMFLLKESTRHAFNQDRSEAQFRANYFKLFKRRLPHMDTVEHFLRKLPPDQLDQLKATLVKELIEKKVLHRFRLLDKHFMIAIDGTGAHTFAANDQNESRSHKTSKNGVTTYYQYVVEAKLITANKMAISIASEWVTNEAKDNEEPEFDKQDCEQKAFERLAAKIKKYFPRLPVCILADGLYPHKTFFKTCQNNEWEYIVVLKDKSLKSLQEDIIDTENKKRQSLDHEQLSDNGLTLTQRKYEWITDSLTYSEFNMDWLSCTETVTKYHKNKKVKSVAEPKRFVTLTSLKVNKHNVCSIAQGGRFRWKIENEGFNIQKNQGYNLEHKYTRNTFDCYKNYYQCLQIAHMINQLAAHTCECIAFKNSSQFTITHLWENLWCTLKTFCMEEKDIATANSFQIRLAG